MSTLDATDMQEIRKLLDEMNHEYVSDGDIKERTMHNFMFLFPDVYESFKYLLDCRARLLGLDND